ncbi:MAG: SET domain-containing protein-lysine N-methyltransferase [archaeon]
MKKYPSKVINISYGKALIATKNLLSGTIVETFKGKIMTYEKVPIEMIRYAIHIGDGKKNKWLVSKTNAIYANHSCNPNCSIDDNLNIVTIKKIKKGKELTYSYNLLEENEQESDFVWDKRWNFECKCGSKNCQKNIDRYKKNC